MHDANCRRAALIDGAFDVSLGADILACRYCVMRVIFNKMIVVFGSLHPGANGALQAWRKIIESNAFANFAELKRAFHSVDKVGDFYVFNVGGNKYRIVTIVRFDAKKVFVRKVLTHKEYNSWKP